MSKLYNAILTEDSGGYVALNPETGVASQGDSLDDALANLREALELYLEEIDDDERAEIQSHKTFMTTLSV